MSDQATVSPEVKDLGDKIANLTLKQAQELVDYLKEAYKIEPAGGGMMVAAAAPAAAAGEKEPEKTVFDVELTDTGAQKGQGIKAVRELTQLSLKEAKETVESAPTMLKTGLPKKDAETFKAKLEEAGAKVTLK